MSDALANRLALAVRREDVLRPADVAGTSGSIAVGSNKTTGAAVRVARGWERWFLAREADVLVSLLGPSERILDLCAVHGVHAGRLAPVRMYVLTNLRVLRTSGSKGALRAEESVPLCEVEEVVAGRVREGPYDALDPKRGNLLFPTPSEAVAAWDAIFDARAVAPEVERGALAGASGLALSEEDA